MENQNIIFFVCFIFTCMNYIVQNICIGTKIELNKSFFSYLLRKKLIIRDRKRKRPHQSIHRL